MSDQIPTERILSDADLRPLPPSELLANLKAGSRRASGSFRGQGERGSTEEALATDAARIAAAHGSGVTVRSLGPLLQHYRSTHDRARVGAPAPRERADLPRAEVFARATVGLCVSFDALWLGVRVSCVPLVGLLPLDLVASAASPAVAVPSHDRAFWRPIIQAIASPHVRGGAGWACVSA